MRQLLLVALLASIAHANGRPPNTQSITFRPGDESHIVAGMTFGELVSRDGGATWHWMCEAAVGYAGAYDPDYAIAANGDVFATTLGGLRVNRTGCTYELTGLVTLTPSNVETVAAATVHVAISDPLNATIVTSADNGASFPTVATPGQASDWWETLRVAPSSALRLYLSGYRLDDGTRVPLLFTSDNGGQSFTAMTTTNMLLSPSSIVKIVGVAPSAPTTVYAIVTFENNTTSDGVYVSTNAGGTWARMVGGASPLVFLARSNGHLVIASPSTAQVSDDGGMTWDDLVSPPPISCLTERANGEVWACSSDFTPGAYRIVKSTDLASWTGVLRFADIDGPVACAAGTVQHDTCDVQQWCVLRMQLGITADPTGCDPSFDGSYVDGPPDAAAPPDAAMPPPPTDGCCDTRRSHPPLILALLVLIAARSCRRRGRPGQTGR